MQLRIDHPIARDNETIVTEAVIGAYDRVVETIRDGIPGIVITGANRVGKSIAIKMIADMIERDFPGQVAVFTAIVKVAGKTSQGDFYRRLLSSMNVFHERNARVSDLEDIVVAAITMEAIENDNNAILFLDEASNMTDVEFCYLMNIFNRVKDVGVNLTTVLVGTDALLKMKEHFKAIGQTQIVARFMTRTYEYSLVDSKRSLQVILGAYDNILEYEGKTYTDCFFPLGYMQGKRLADHENVEMLFSLFKEALEIRTDQTLVITMQHLILTIRICFLETGIYGEKKEWPDEDDWRSAIKKSGFREDMISGDMGV